MEFEKRLERAIQRGQRARTAEGRASDLKATSEEDLRNQHSAIRIELSDHIEKCLRQLADHFPGFQFETIVGEDGWGARITRDDVNISAGRGSRKLYSRLEMVIRPFTSSHIVSLNTKGTIRNKESLTRSHYQFLSEIDSDSFTEMIDLWVLEYAEQYAGGQ